MMPLKVRTKEQLREFLNAAEKHPNYKLYVYFRLLAYSGMRKGEALALTWADIDFTNSEIDINKALGQGKGQRLYPKPPKTGKPRTIKMDETTMVLLKKWKKKQLIFSNTRNNFIQPAKTNDWVNLFYVIQCYHMSLRMHLGIHIAPYYLKREQRLNLFKIV